MTTTMTLPAGSVRSDWQSNRTPRLSYRNPLPPGETHPTRDTVERPANVDRPAHNGLSIREIREALPQELPSLSPVNSASPTISSQKMKKSFLGGLFAKEPSMAALDQVAQQMMVQHGSISPKVIPHVSSQKMPGHVPKVNAKWDGVPEQIKRREREEKKNARAFARNSLLPINTLSTDEPALMRRRKSDAASTAESWDSRSTGSRPVFHDTASMRPESIYSTSSERSIYTIQRSPSSTTPTFSSYAVTESSQESSEKVDESGTVRSRACGLTGRSPAVASPPEDTFPEYISSPSSTPMERSPQTPAPIFAEGHTAPKVSAARPGVRRTSSSKSGNLLQSRSRNGLGLYTSSAVAPWETQAPPRDSSNATETNSPAKSRGIGRMFNKEKR